MAVNPWEGVQQAQWAGRNMMKAGQDRTGPLGEQVGKTGWRSRAEGPAPTTGGYKQPGPAQGAPFQVSNALGRPDYGSQQVDQRQQQQTANTRGRRGAFGKGGGGAGGITIQNQFGDNAFGIGNVSGQNNAGGIGNMIGDNNTNSGNMGIGNYQAGGPAPTAGATAPAPAPAGPAPKGTKPGRTPIPVGGAPAPKALPAGGSPTPVGAGPAAPTPVGSGPKPIGALGPGTAGTPTPAKPQGTKDVRTRKEKIEAVAAQGATPGERAAATAAQERISGAPASTPSTPAISAPATQAPSAPEQQAPSAPQASAPTGLRQRRPVTGFDKRTLEPAGAGKIGPRSYPDGTVDDREYTVGGQRLMPAGEDPGYGGVQPSAVQPKRDTQGSTAPAPAAQAPAEKAKTTAKKTVAKAAAKTPAIRNTSQKPKVALKAKAPVKKQTKKGK